MIVDHLVTRTGVRSLAWIVSGVVPLAASYLAYMVTYQESPLDTLMKQMTPLVELLQSNGTWNVNSTTITGSTRLSTFIPDTMPSASSARLSPSGSSAPGIPAVNSSLIVSYFLQIVQHLERQGYTNCESIPGCVSVRAWQAPVQEYLQPLIEFVVTHQTLAWIMTGLHLWLVAEIVFYILFWKKLARLQEVDRVVKGVGSKAKRTELFERCLETVGEGDGARRWIEVWFDTGRTRQPARFEEIGRSNMIHW
jgi:hypothetical protein